MPYFIIDGLLYKHNFTWSCSILFFICMDILTKTLNFLLLFSQIILPTLIIPGTGIQITATHHIWAKCSYFVGWWVKWAIKSISWHIRRVHLMPWQQEILYMPILKGYRIEQHFFVVLGFASCFSKAAHDWQ